MRAVCQQHGGRMRTWQREDPQASQAFAAADGDIEFPTDGTAVNTPAGWREMRLSLFCRRPRGEPARPEQWEERNLPAPHVRVITAGIRTSERLSPQGRRTAGRLGIQHTAEITALADGAKWIWNQVEKQRPGATGVLASTTSASPSTPRRTTVWVKARRRRGPGSRPTGKQHFRKAAGRCCASCPARPIAPTN
jgi:hypothetical protein